MEIQTVGIVGYGAFGTLLSTLLRRFAPSLEVRVHSSRSAPDGEVFFTLEDAASCDALILAVPIRHFEATLVNVLPLMTEKTIIIDVATVKMYTTEILKRLMGEKRYIATHPMWGPESYEKRAGDITGFRVVVADTSLPEEEKHVLIHALRGIGFDVVEMSAETHDRHLAETLFLTHFVGQIVSKAGFNRTEIDTVSFGYLMDAVESVKHDTELFKDVFQFNPYCREVLERFDAAEAATRDILEA